MAWTKLQYNRRQINEAGSIFHSFARVPAGDEIVRAIDIIDNFRVAHAYPLTVLQTTLRNRGCVIYTDCIIAQRLKRLSAILSKLNRFPTMKLWDMQDIGGCRAVLDSIAAVQKLVDTYKSSKYKITSKFVGEKDYINHPKDSGYRSRHLVYRYIGENNHSFDSLKIEIQIRTNLQHAWATAVETVDAFTKQALKSSKGKPDWERFFQLMGSEMAYRENTPLVPNTPSDREELHKELSKYTKELQVEDNFKGFTAAIKSVRKTRAIKSTDYILLSLDTKKKRLFYTVYPRKELAQAAEEYAKIEQIIRETKEGDAVLVSVDSFNNLQRAYPNYFADTGLFLEVLRDSIKRRRRFFFF